MIPKLLLMISGLSAGLITAAAYVAFIAMLGIFPKIAAKTNTAKQCILYETCLMGGILLSTLLQFGAVYSSSSILQSEILPKPLGITLLACIGLFGGIYIGFLISGLSEMLNVIPIYSRKAKLQKWSILVIYFIALGKGIFSLIFFFQFK